MKNSTNRRKPNSIFDEQVKAINSFGIGSTYKVKDMRDRMKVGKYNTDRVGDYHLDLLSTNCIKRVKHGQYQVIGLIPDFLTLNMCEANRGYTISRPNPKYIGKSDSYGNSGNYDNWYIDGIRPFHQVERGVKWKLGEPNPFHKQETTSDHTNLPGAKRETVNTYLGEVLNSPTKAVTAMFGRTLLIIISINNENSNTAVCLNPNDGKRLIVSLADLTEIAISVKPNVHTFDKHAQIVEILKRGLSASDAADLILKTI